MNSKSRNVLFVCIGAGLAFLLSSCVGAGTLTATVYDIDLESAQRGGDANSLGDDVAITNTDMKTDIRTANEYKRKDESVSRYEGEIVDVIFSVNYADWFYTIGIENKTSEDMVVDWRNARFIDEEGEGSRVLPENVSLEPGEDFEQTLPEQRISSKGKIVRSIIPFSDLNLSISGESSFSVDSKGNIDFQNLSSSPFGMLGDKVGYTFEIWLPIKVDNKVAEYVFRFKITNSRDVEVQV